VFLGSSAALQSVMMPVTHVRRVVLPLIFVVGMVRGGVRG